VNYFSILDINTGEGSMWVDYTVGMALPENFTIEILGEILTATGQLCASTTMSFIITVEELPSPYLMDPILNFEYRIDYDTQLTIPIP
jgi:hypothetical protein